MVSEHVETKLADLAGRVAGKLESTVEERVAKQEKQFQASQLLAETGNTSLAKDVEMAATFTDNLANLAIKALEVSKNVAEKAAIHRDMANTIDAAISMIPGLLSGKLKDKSNKYLAISEAARTQAEKGIKEIEKQYMSKVAAQGAVQAVKDAAVQAGRTYSQNSIVINTGKALIKGVGAASRVIAKKGVQTVQSAQNFANQAVQNAQAFGAQVGQKAQGLGSTIQQTGQNIKNIANTYTL